MNIVRNMSKAEFENLKRGDKVYIRDSGYSGKVNGTVGKFINHYNNNRKDIAYVENPQWLPKRLAFRVDHLGILISVGE